MPTKNLSLLIALVALGACTAEPTPEISLTKDEARGMAGKADGLDLCLANGWYGDDVCDDFCPSPDPDCRIRCGPNTCAGDQVCCNSSCGICTEPGGVCTQQACLGDGGVSDVDGGTPLNPGDGGTPLGDGWVDPGDGGTPWSDGWVDPGDGWVDPGDGWVDPGDGGTPWSDGWVDPGDGGVRCGDRTCGAGLVCCNPSCGICTPPGVGCIRLACPPDAGAP